MPSRPGIYEYGRASRKDSRPARQRETGEESKWASRWHADSSASKFFARSIPTSRHPPSRLKRPPTAARAIPICILATPRRPNSSSTGQPASHSPGARAKLGRWALAATRLGILPRRSFSGRPVRHPCHGQCSRQFARERRGNGRAIQKLKSVGLGWIHPQAPKLGKRGRGAKQWYETRRRLGENAG
jgi:hypothetical protein